MLKKILTLASVLLAFSWRSAPAAETSDGPTLTVGYDTLRAKATRFYNQKEWASAMAMFELMLDEKPRQLQLYPAALAAAGMSGDTLSQHELTEKALLYHMPVDSIFAGLRERAVAIGHSEVYEDYLERVARWNPWLRRAADASLLRYYAFRRNGPMTVVFARKMLAGLPDNVGFMTSLAAGYMDCGDIPAAREVWSRILSIEPDNYTALVWLGNALLLDGDKENALPYLKRACAIKATPRLEALIAPERRKK